MLAAALLLGGCSDAAPPDGAPASPRPSTSAPAPGPSGARPGASVPDASAVSTALDTLLEARDAAVRTGDTAAFRATVAAPTDAAGRRQLQTFGAARALGLSQLSHDVAPPADDPAAVDVTLRYRVAGVDRAERTATVRYALRRAGERWLVADETATGTDAAPPWLAMPGLTVRRGRSVVVAGTAPEAALAAAATTVDRSLPVLARLWPGTPRRTLVLLPETPAEAATLRGDGGAAVGRVAATTDGPTDAAGLATGDRVLVDPDARRRLTPVGRDVVLTHELAHVAVRGSVPGTAPLWLSEGYADHVGYARAGLPERTLAAPLVAAVRAGTAPAALPTDTALDPGVSDIEVGYLAAWQAAQTVVALAGEAGLRRLVRACTATGGAEAAARACDAAMPGVIGTDRAGLTRRWRQRLAALAR
ncbi:hypothetical protein ATL31_0394 [Phycicoccus duodecadis]|uniref:Peptidase MA superfamily protein n=1 Tax=Phycicoccus duodecadis TaxID=173053 RepID=A0A2N3YFF2_9MICO|nr:hypothetical protein ATL31_0394 [Phycicoccus duodecadis]